jgi:hypothetical protein
MHNGFGNAQITKLVGNGADVLGKGFAEGDRSNHNSLEKFPMLGCKD